MTRPGVSEYHLVCTLCWARGHRIDYGWTDNLEVFERWFIQHEEERHPERAEDSKRALIDGTFWAK